MSTHTSEANPLRRRAGCPDLDPKWPDVTGAPRGPRVCVLYPKCKCGKEDRAMTERSQPAQLPSKKRAHDWTGPTRHNMYVHCSVCGKIFQILKAKGSCPGKVIES